MAGEVAVNGGGLLDDFVSAVMYVVDYMLDGLTVLLGWLGLNFNASEKEILALILAVIIVATLLEYFIKLFGKWIVNSLVGLLVLLLLHYLFGVSIPLTLFTLLVVAVFGVPGLLALIILHIGGIL